MRKNQGRSVEEEGDIMGDILCQAKQQQAENGEIVVLVARREAKYDERSASILTLLTFDLHASLILRSTPQEVIPTSPPPATSSAS